MSLVITKVFPDEYHLHTLDLMLSAIARLNPHVDMKKIVIGLMDRLSSYAARESETTEDPTTKQKAEEEAVTKLLEKLKVSEKAKGDESAESAAIQENGAKAEEQSEAPDESEKPSEEKATTNGVTGVTKTGIPGDIKLYEIFYEQVVNLIKTRGLPIQDALALLVSLVNLAL